MEIARIVEEVIKHLPMRHRQETHGRPSAIALNRHGVDGTLIKKVDGRDIFKVNRVIYPRIFLSKPVDIVFYAGDTYISNGLGHIQTVAGIMNVNSEDELNDLIDSGELQNWETATVFDGTLNIFGGGKVKRKLAQKFLDLEMPGETKTLLSSEDESRTLNLYEATKYKEPKPIRQRSITPRVKVPEVGSTVRYKGESYIVENVEDTGKGYHDVSITLPPKRGSFRFGYAGLRLDENGDIIGDNE